MKSAKPEYRMRGLSLFLPAETENDHDPTTSTVIAARHVEAELRRISAQELSLDVREAQETVEQLIADLNVPPDIALYVALPNGALVYANEKYLELARNAESAHERLRQVNDILPPRLRNIFTEIQLTQAPVVVDEILLINHRRRTFQSRHFPLTGPAKELVAIAGTYSDITREARALTDTGQAEARLADFARASSDWFWETDEMHRFVYLSDGVAQLSGQPAITLLGKSFLDLGVFVRPDKEGSFIESAALPAAMTRHSSFRDAILDLKDPDGRTRCYHVSGVAVFEPASGQFTGFRGAATEMTARYHAEKLAYEARRELERTLEELTNKNAQLDIASAEAQAALQAKSEFFAAMSHELRTPLNAIIGFSEAMGMQVFGELNEQYTGYCNDIASAARHLLGLINDVLDVAVIERGKINLDIKSVSIRNTLERALNLVIIRANDKNLDTTCAAVETDIEVLADPMRTTQIFVNLLSNAVKFTPEGGQIGIDIARPDKDFAEIVVWDTGIGISEEMQDAVFEKFQQAKDDVYARKEEGTGLGLHISRQLAELMGGSLSLESKKGKGSRFTVRLPLAPPPTG